MTKINKFIAYTVISLIVSSCCMSKADRAQLNKASTDAKEAHLIASEALFLAEDAIKDADNATKKSERIFKQTQKK